MGFVFSVQIDITLLRLNANLWILIANPIRWVMARVLIAIQATCWQKRVVFLRPPKIHIVRQWLLLGAASAIKVIFFKIILVCQSILFVKQETTKDNVYLAIVVTLLEMGFAQLLSLIRIAWSMAKMEVVLPVQINTIKETVFVIELVLFVELIILQMEVVYHAIQVII
jgi:hypothetical protein